MNQRWKTRAFLGLKIAVSAALIAVLVSRIGVRSLWSVIAGASPGGMLVAAAIVLVSQALGAWQWGRLLAAGGVHVPPLRVIAYAFGGTFLNLALPGGVGGDVARVLGVMQESPRKRAIVGATVIDRLLGGAIMGLLAIIGYVFSKEALGETRNVIGPIVIVYAAASIAGLVLLLGHASAILRFFARLIPHKLAAKLEGWDDSLARQPGTRQLSFLVIAFAVQAFRILAHAQVARALDIDVGLRYFFLFIPLLAIGVALPISIGGLGVRETLGALLFGILGIDAAEASAMQLLGYFLSVAVSLPGALALVLMGVRPRPRSQEGLS